jgi:glycosyl transferase family 87
VVARSESRSSPADLAREPWVAIACAVALFAATWATIHVGFYRDLVISDVPVYQSYGDAISRGEVPYRDFGLEYPPGALPVFALPSLGNTDDFGAYRRAFELEMWVCGAIALVALGLALKALGAGAGRLWAALAFTALAPLALGSVVRARFDLWPVALTLLALAALLRGRRAVGGAVLGLAFAAKLWPGVLLPLAVAYAWRRHGRRAGLAVAASFVVAAALVFLPFAILAPDGLYHSLTRQTSRPLQIEALGASFLLVAHQFGLAIHMVSGSGSQNLRGSLADALAALQTLVQALVLVGLWAAFARGPASRERLVRYAAACACAFVAFGKVLSPQFLVWLIPLVPLVGGRRGLAASALLGLILVLTQSWFPHRYWRLALEFDAPASWLVLVRDLLLVALVALLAWTTGREPERARSG